jgi:hypothetical protein
MTTARSGQATSRPGRFFQGEEMKTAERIAALEGRVEQLERLVRELLARPLQPVQVIPPPAQPPALPPVTPWRWESCTAPPMIVGGRFIS